MGNVMDYLVWRGDISFQKDCCNEVDNLIFSVLMYLPFDQIVPESLGDSVTLKEAWNSFVLQEKGKDVTFESPIFKDIPRLLERAAETERFGDIQISGYRNMIDVELAEQFSAMVFTIDENFHFVAFRGTDNTLAGWIEDLQMSFLDTIPSQKYAASYLEMVMNQLPGNCYLGGHSKGGNLAVYAAMQIDDLYHSRIIKIYNNDGPGFLKKTVNSPPYLKIVDKIITFLPQYSVVGMLLEHKEAYEVVKSSQNGFLQHDGLSWEVMGRTFVKEPSISKASKSVNKTMRAWLKKLTLGERENFVHVLFFVLKETGAVYVSDLSKEQLVKVNKALKAYGNLDQETKKQVKKAVDLLFSESHKTFRIEVSKKVMKNKESQRK